MGMNQNQENDCEFFVFFCWFVVFLGTAQSQSWAQSGGELWTNIYQKVLKNKIDLVNLSAAQDSAESQKCLVNDNNFYFLD